MIGVRRFGGQQEPEEAFRFHMECQMPGLNGPKLPSLWIPEYEFVALSRTKLMVYRPTVHHIGPGRRGLSFRSGPTGRSSWGPEIELGLSRHIARIRERRGPFFTFPFLHETRRCGRRENG